jgi:hypothetical protein
MKSINDFTPAVISALEGCRRVTEKSGNEFCIVLGQYDEHVVVKEGDTNFINFDPAEIDAIHFRGNILVHSHPSNSPLSVPDMNFAVDHQLTVIAITPRKDVYWTSGLVGDKLKIHNRFYEHEGLFSDLRHSGYVSRVILSDMWAHRQWSIAVALGDVDYHYHITPETLSEYNQILAAHSMLIDKSSTQADAETALDYYSREIYKQKYSRS